MLLSFAIRGNVSGSGQLKQLQFLYIAAAFIQKLSEGSLSPQADWGYVLLSVTQW